MDKLEKKVRKRTKALTEESKLQYIIEEKAKQQKSAATLYQSIERYNRF